MNQRKLNMFRILGLTLILLIGSVAALTGVAFARYRVDRTEQTELTPRTPEYIHLGTLEKETEDAEPVFQAGIQNTWELKDGRYQLSFAVANGTDAETFAESDQEFRVRLIGTMGVWDGEDTVDVILQVPSIPSEEDPEKPLEIPATATRIQPGSILYEEFGEGWVFSFYDPWKDEWKFDLPGEELNALELVLIVNEADLTDPSLLQLQITGYFESH